jgi:hypothetical protein
MPDIEQMILDSAHEAVKNAPEGDPDGYAHYYRLRMNKPIPKHVFHWTEEAYKAHADHMGLLVEAARGFTKTTWGLTFLEYRMGLEPHKRNTVFRASDEKSWDSVGKIATTIEHNPVWKLIFPHVVPDKNLTWSTRGYTIKRDDVEYDTWIRKTVSETPTLTGFGYMSGTYLGGHPDGVLWMDDLNTKENTYSPLDRKKVQSTVQESIFPMIVPETWDLYSGTPWMDDDLIAYLKSTRDFRHVYLPAQENGQEGGVPTWPEKFPMEVLQSWKRRMGSRAYACQMLLNTKAAMGQVLLLKWLKFYPSTKIERTWRKVLGVDYASTQYELGEKEKDRFAIALEYEIPGGGAVLADGFVGNLSQGEAEQKVMQWAEMCSPHEIGVENIGSGRELYSSLIRSTRLPVRPSKLKNKNIGYWVETELAPLCEFGRLMISDEPTEFLQAFQNEWAGYPNEHDDTLAAVWHATKMAMPNLENITAGDYVVNDRKKKNVHPAVWFAKAE